MNNLSTNAANPTRKRAGLGIPENLRYLAAKPAPMTHDLQLFRFRSPADPGWAEAMALYRDSFPGKERRGETQMIAALADPDFRADAIRRRGRTVGILFHWQYGDTSYIEHLAVAPALRGQHIGADVLTDFCRGRRVVLEIDPPETEIARRRQCFYERVGFVVNPHLYIHPSYGDPEQPHRLVLMSYPAPLTNDEARGFADFVREHVLHYSALQRPVALPALP